MVRASRALIFRVCSGLRLERIPGVAGVPENAGGCRAAEAVGRSGCTCGDISEMGIGVWMFKGSVKNNLVLRHRREFSLFVSALTKPDVAVFAKNCSD